MNRFAIAAALVCAPLVASAQVIDQSAGGGLLFAQIPNWTGQSFTTSATTLLGGGFRLFGTGTAGTTTGTLTVALYDGAAHLGGVQLATQTVSYSLTGGVGTLVDAFWASPVSVTSGATYWLYGRGTVDGDEPVYLMGSLNGYAGGAISYASSPTITTAPETNWSGYDAAFRTWQPTPEEGPPSTTVPEPSTGALLALAAVPLGLLAGYRRRRA